MTSQTSPNAVRRVALVANYSWTLKGVSTPYTVYLDGFARIGVEAISVCRAGCEAGYPHPVVTVSGDADLGRREFWDGVGCDSAVVWSWLGNVELMRAIRACGVRVLALGDSDGLASPLYHPVSTFKMGFPIQPPTVWKVLRMLPNHLSVAVSGARVTHRRVADSVLSPNVHTLPSVGAIAALDRGLSRAGRHKAVGVMRWLPYPVPNEICDRPVELRRENRIIAVGRWDAWQKNASLLARTIDMVCAAGPGPHFTLVGAASDTAFAPLAARYPGRVTALGRVPRERVGELMATCRSLLMSSRWEGSPQVANEMLASGGTVVGTPIPSLVGITDNNRFGRVSLRHTAHALAAAVRDELACWDSGGRDPAQIAAHWRPLVSPEAVALRILRLLDIAPV